VWCEQLANAAKQVLDLRGVGVSRALGFDIPATNSSVATATPHTHPFTLSVRVSGMLWDVAEY
jgi:hypothetical protein